MLDPTVRVTDDQDPGQWTVPVDMVDVNPRQPREVFDETAMAELIASVSEVGVLQPIMVRPKVDGRYELIVGERRLRAAQAAGLERVPATLRRAEDDQMLPLAVLENIHRRDLNPLELAGAYNQLLEDHDLTHAEVATLLKVDRSHVSRTLALLRLPAKVQRRVAAGVLSASHAEALTTIQDPYVCELLAARIVAEGLSVHTVREMIAVGGLPGAETLDGRDEARRRRRVPRPVPEELRAVADDLGDRLDTRVRVMAGKSRGRIVVDFSDRDDLQRILNILRGESQPD